MKTKMNHLIIFLFVLGLGLNGCAVPATPPTQTAALQPTPTGDPNVALVLEMVARLNEGNVEGSLAYFSEDALTYFIGMPPTGMEYYQGREAIRPTWEFAAGDNFKWELEIIDAWGDFVSARTKTWMDFTRELGVAPNEFTEIFKIEDGKITLYSSTMTEQALEEFKPALLEVMPMPPTPDTSAENPGSDLNFTFEGGTCTYDGPAVLKAGDLKVNVEVKDQDRESFALTFFTLEEGKDLVDLMASTTRPVPPSWSDMFFLSELSPGESKTSEITVEEGEVYVVCFSKPPEIPIGNLGPLEVKP